MTSKSLRVFDIGTPWGMFDVKALKENGIPEYNCRVLAERVFSDLKAGVKIKGINA